MEDKEIEMKCGIINKCCTLSLEYPEKKLQDDYYCTELSYEVALQSSLAEKLIKDSNLFKTIKRVIGKSRLWNYDIVLKLMN